MSSSDKARMRFGLTMVLLAGALVAPPASAMAAPPSVHGALTLRGCIRDTGATLLTACSGSTGGLNEPADVVVVGQNVYVAASGGGTFPNGSDIAAFTVGPDGAPSPLGCIMQSGSNAGCTATASGLNTPVSLVANESNVYVASLNSQAVATLSRAANGTLSAGGCVKDAASTETCAATGHALAQPAALALAPGGGNVYVASITDSAVATLVPGTGGALAFTGCIKLTSSAATCSEDGEGLKSARGVAVSGANVYVADPSVPGDAVAVLMRGAGGALSFGSCVKDPSSSQTCSTMAEGLNGGNDVAVSPDGKNVYVAADHTIVVFNRAADGALAPAGCFQAPGSGMGCDNDAPGLTIGGHVDVSADGRNVYASGSNITLFTRDPATGALTPSGCLGQTSADGCTAVAGIYNIAQLAISPSGAFVYAADSLGDISWFSRQVAPTCTDQSVQVPFGASPAIQLSCSDANGDPITISTTAPTHGAVTAVDQEHAQLTYTPAPGYAGDDSFTFTASDGGLTSAPATVTLTDAPAPAVADPIVSAFSVSPKRFAVGPGRTAISARRPPRGTTFAYTLSMAGTVKIKLARRVPGRRVGKRCLAPTKARRHRKRCVRSIGSGTLTRAAAAGSNKTKFSGRVGSRRLRVGAYRATIVETTAGAAHASAPRRASFRVVAR
jgi:hypothetical protein